MDLHEKRLSLDTQLSALSLTARFDEDIEVWAVSVRHTQILIRCKHFPLR